MIVSQVIREAKFNKIMPEAVQGSAFAQLARTKLCLLKISANLPRNL